MKIRKIQYNIDYVHILSFREQYKNAIMPYFGFDGLRYGIDNENSLNESVRLLFTKENFAIQLRKEGMTLVYEGDAAELKKANGVCSLFFDLIEKIKAFNGFHRMTKHSMTVNAVHIDTEERVQNILKNNPYFKNNPFPNVHEFNNVYEFKKDSYKCKFEFGNFTPEDIKRYDLLPFKSEYNLDLIDGVGMMCKLYISGEEKNPNFNKFKKKLMNSEELIYSFNLIWNE